MTYLGAIKQLHDLRNAEDMPIPVKQSPMDDALDKFRNVVRGFDKSLFASREEK